MLGYYSNSEFPAEKPISQREAILAVDRMFLDGAQKALKEGGYKALEFLAANPGVSEKELATRLNRGVTIIGLIMAIYYEAAKQGTVRETAKDLLIRDIIAEFPNGWETSEDPDPLSKLGGWLVVCQYGLDPRITDYTQNILRHLTIDHPPIVGWRPQLKNDPLIDELFDRYWPGEAR